MYFYKIKKLLATTEKPYFIPNKSNCGQKERFDEPKHTWIMILPKYISKPLSKQHTDYNGRNDDSFYKQWDM